MTSVVAEIPIPDIPRKAWIDVAVAGAPVEFSPDERIFLLPYAAKAPQLAPAVPDQKRATQRRGCEEQAKHGGLSVEIAAQEHVACSGGRQDYSDHTETKPVHVFIRYSVALATRQFNEALP